MWALKANSLTSPLTVTVTVVHELRLRLSSSRSEQNIGRRVVSIWHDRWQYLSHHSSQHPVCPNLLSVSLTMSSLVVRPSSCHLLVSILRPDWLVWLLGGNAGKGTLFKVSKFATVVQLVDQFMAMADDSDLVILAGCCTKLFFSELVIK